MNLTDITTYVRLGASGAVTALAALYTYYPHQLWIPAVVSAAATYGIHAIPSISQSIKQSLVKPPQ